ncbi:MAG: hypothetical protein KTR15_01380 [Phycisphaeraceae bacterium]|nr:hypothetical protein [Phycisphaeraceae bacterium]
MPTRLKKPLIALLLIVLALPTAAQTLIDQVPASSALYVGWRGSNDLGPGYAGSNLQGMLQEMGLLEAVPELVELLKNLQTEGHIGEDEAEIIAMTSALITSAWSDGGAMYMLPPDPQGPPIPRLCVMWNKGDAQAQLRDALNTVAEILGEELPTFTGELNQTMYLSIGFDPAEVKAASLSTSARYKAAVRHVQGDAALMVYVDANEWIKQIDQFTDMMRQQAEAQERPADPFTLMWPTLREATGLSGVQSLAMSAGLKDKNWHTRLFLGAPTPRRGILSLLDNEAITPTSLLAVPKTATYLEVFSMQPSRVLDVTMDVAGAIDQEVVGSIQGALKEASEEVGFDIEMKLIRGMGPAWTVYVDPMIAGNGFASIVLVNDLQDADAVKQAIIKLSDKANELFAEEDEDVKVRFLTKDIEGVAVTHLGIPFIAPAWAVNDGKLYVSLYPQGLEMAIAQSGKREDSILANDAFQSAMGRFLDAPGPAGAKDRAFDNLRPVTGLSFADLPKTAPEGYGMNMMIMQLITGASEMFSGEASTMRMPPVGKLMPYIEVTGSVTRIDGDGLHVHMVEPFPGATLLSASKGMTTGAGLTAPIAIGVMLPALGSARDAAREVQTTVQGRQISVANFAYAADNKGVYANDIAALEEYIGDIEMMISPRSLRAEAPPANFAQQPDAKRAAFIRKNSSFVLVPLGDQAKLNNVSDTVMLFERPDDTEDFDVMVAMADGSAFTIPQDELAEMLLKQTGESIQQLIQRQENFGK